MLERLGVINNLLINHKPHTTTSGVIISSISIAAMSWLAFSKFKTGKKLSSEPIIEDGKCTLACLYMSIVLLLSSIIYELTGIGYIDMIGTLGIIYFSFMEGREALEN